MSNIYFAQSNRRIAGKHSSSPRQVNRLRIKETLFSKVDIDFETESEFETTDAHG